jgi:hypothetical protein
LAASEEQQFRFLFCRRFNCPLSEYEATAFKKCLYWHARLLAPLVRLLFPQFFADDLKFIGYLGTATDVREALTEAQEFYLGNRRRANFWRAGFKIRVSGRKASRLARALLPARP